MGTVNLLEAIRRAGRPCIIVVVTTDKCYVNREVVWGYREEDPLGGADPYSASKAATEIAAAAYARSFFEGGSVGQAGIRMATARAGNVIGGGDWAANRLVPDIVKAIASGKRVQIRNPTAIRPWQHVLEPLAGYLALASAMSGEWEHGPGSSWNFGPRSGDELPVRTLVNRLCAVWGRGSYDEVPDARAPHEAGILRLSIDKALSGLPWAPKWTADEAIARTAGWYRGCYEVPGFSAYDACMQDIDAYFEPVDGRLAESE